MPCYCLLTLPSIIKFKTSCMKSGVDLSLKSVINEQNLTGSNSVPRKYGRICSAHRYPGCLHSREQDIDMNCDDYTSHWRGTAVIDDVVGSNWTEINIVDHDMSRWNHHLGRDQGISYQKQSSATYCQNCCSKNALFSISYHT